MTLSNTTINAASPPPMQNARSARPPTRTNCAALADWLRIADAWQQRDNEARARRLRHAVAVLAQRFDCTEVVSCAE